MKLPGREVDRRVVDQVDEHNIAHALPTVLQVVTDLHTATDQLRRTVAGDRGVLTSGAVPRTVYGGGSGKLSSSPGRLMGCAIAGAAGAALTVRLHDGQDANGDVLATLVSDAGGRIPPTWFGPSGIAFGQGLYAEVVAGVVDGAFYLGIGPT